MKKTKEIFIKIKKYLKNFLSTCIKVMDKTDVVVCFAFFIALIACIVQVFLGNIEYIFTAIMTFLFIICYLYLIIWYEKAMKLNYKNKFLEKKNKNLKIAVKGLKDDLDKKTEYRKPIRKTIIKEKK